MTPDQLSHIAQQWFHAFNSHDLEALLALYADDAEHYSPKLKLRQPATQGWIKGKAALRTWWQDAFQRLPTLQYELLKLTANEHRVFMEYIRHVKGEEDLPVGEVLEIRNHLIVSSRVYHG
ncbi:MAG: nuclear transport factor 2 family protein [Chitinophagales bacterium]|nr:nuclear transport factor 2 family protein [Chitinophagales bacterium]